MNLLIQMRYALSDQHHKRDKGVNVLFLLLQDNNTQYARLYDLSRSSPDEINALVSDMITNGVSLESTNDLLRLASRQTPQSWRVIHALQDCLTRILNALR